MYHLDASMDGCGSSVNASKRQLARSKYADLSMYDSLLGPSCSFKFDLENGELIRTLNDHTYQTDQGYYMYIKSRLPQKKGFYL